jgi:hypothetical protein
VNWSSKVSVHDATIRIALILPMVVGWSACRPERDLEAEAVEAVIVHLMTRAPAGGVLYLLPEWQIPHTGQVEPIPTEIGAAMRRVSGLSMPDDQLGRQADDAAFLYLFRPLVAAPDSIAVLAGWLRRTGGDGGGGWGHEFHYTVDCTKRCSVGLPAESHWN